MEKIEKDKAIKREKARLSKVFKNLPQDIKTTSDGLVHAAAHMKISLEEYEKDLDKNGYVELFRQAEGLNPYERERPVARLYINTVCGYISVCKQLIDLLPEESKSSM